MLHLRLVLHLALTCVTFEVGITCSVVITFSGDTALRLLAVNKKQIIKNPLAFKT